MSTERWQRLDRIFIEAIQRPAAERSGFIADACRNDAALKAEALELLAASDDSSEFMATSALEYLARTVAAGGWSLKAGERIGVYTVLNRLGAGSSGEVWRARDERLGRDVAIKSCCRTRRVTRSGCVALRKKPAWPDHSTIRTC